MTTCAVTALITKQDGTPDVGAVVTAKLNGYDVASGYVGPITQSAVADVNGLATLNLWPNALGATSSYYDIIINGAEKTLRTTAVVPNLTTVALETIAQLPVYPGKPDGQVAVDAAVAAGVTALAQAAIATTQAGIATTQAGIATTQAGTATTQAAAAASSAGAAAGSASAASGYATTAQGYSDTTLTYQNTTLTARDAAIAARDLAQSYRDTALTYSTAASTYATNASTSAGAAATSATNAANSAGAAGVSATNASNFATTCSGYVSQTQTSATAAAASATLAGTWATVATDQATKSASSASLALAIFGTAAGLNAAQQIMLGYANTAAAQALLAAGYAASAASVVQQDLSGVSAQALHRSPNAIVASPIVYDAGKDSDGGAWIDQCQNRGWYVEALNGPSLGFASSETEARDIQGQGASLVTGDSSTFAGGIGAWIAGGSTTLTAVNGRLRITATASASPVGSLVITTVIGQRYKIDVSYLTAATGKNSTIGAGTAQGSNNIAAVNMGSTANGPNYIAFVATTTTTYINLQGSASWVNGDFSEIDDITVRPVDATLAALGGTTYQSKADGKYYVLSAGAGQTEIFRGSTAKWSRLALLVPEAGSLTVYSGDQVGRPMWGRWAFAAGTFGTITSIRARDGKIFLGTSLGLITLDLVADIGRFQTTSLDRTFSLTDRASGAQTLTTRATTQTIAAVPVNAVAITVRSTAPFDPVTGLPAPTVAVAHGTGNAGNVGTVLMDDGTTVTYAQSGQDGTSVMFTDRGDIVWSMSAQTTVYALPLATSNVASISAITGVRTYTSGGGAAPTVGTGTGKKLLRAGPLFAAMGGGSINSFTLVRENPSTLAAGLSATIAGGYSTGWMVGDTRRCLLASTTAGAISPTSNLIPDPGFDDPASLSFYAKQDNNVTISISGGVFNLSTNSSAASDSAYFLALPTEQGAQYTITAAFSVVSNCTGGYFGARNGPLQSSPSVTTISGNVGTGSASLTPSVTFTADGPITTIRMSMAKTSNAAAGTYDNFSVVRITEPDRSYKIKPMTIFGTLAKTAVAAAAQLVAYAGFAAANYLQEAYSADYDTGTGALRVSAWATAPTTLPVASFPEVTGTELCVNGDFSSATGWTTGTGWAIAGGVATKTAGSVGNLTETVATAGHYYKVTFTISGMTAGAVQGFGTSAVYGNANANGTWTILVKCSTTTIGVQASNTFDGTIDNVSFKEVGMACIFDRSAATGAYYRLGASPIGEFVGELYDGTTTRTVISPAAYNNGLFNKVAMQYDGAGTLSLAVNGATAATATGAALLTLNNATAVTTIGNRRQLDAAWPGSLALVNFGVTNASANAAQFAYAQEAEIFRAGAQITLPDTGGMTDFSYDDMETKLKVVTAANEASFVGLVRTATAAVSYGTFSKAGMRGGVKLLARATTAPGVDVSIPAYGLREEMYNRAERAAALARLDEVIDFDAVTSQTDFALPAGYTAKEVIAAGASKREGATKDWTRLYDGFVETERFSVAPGNLAWVQIKARRAA